MYRNTFDLRVHLQRHFGRVSVAFSGCLRSSLSRAFSIAIMNPQTTAPIRVTTIQNRTIRLIEFTDSAMERK